MNWFKIISVIVIIAITVFNVYERNKIENMKDAKGNCWITNLDGDGVGFSFPTEYCLQLKTQCKSSVHNVPCSWYDEFENNESDGRCVCIWWD